MVSRRGELDELALRLARVSCDMLSVMVDGELRKLLPDIHSQIWVGSEESLRPM
jgi:hypothetical protein